MNRWQAGVLLIVGLCGLSDTTEADKRARIIVGSRTTGLANTNIERLLDENEYFDALVEFEKIPHRQLTIPSVIAAGKSAWALSLPVRAEEELSRALAMEQIEEHEKTEALFSRAIIKYQEARFQEAVVDVEKVIGLLKQPSPDRGRAYLLLAESDQALGAYGKSVDLYERSMKELVPNEKGNSSLGLAKSYIFLGQNEKAISTLQLVDESTELWGEAVRMLIPLLIEEGKFSETFSLVTKAMKENRTFTLDSYYEFVRMRALIGMRKNKEARSVLEQAQSRFPPSDPWVILAESLVEESIYQGTTERTEVKSGEGEWKEVKFE